MKLSRWISSLLAALVLGAPALAEVRMESVSYEHDGDTLTGYVAWDDSIEGKRPGIIVVHEWWGLNDYAKQRARMLAGLGYVAMAVDMYGQGRVTDHPDKAGEWSTMITSNVERWQARALAGLEQLRARPQVDTGQLAAIGYCFGGSTVMQMAYAGADLDGVVSFHGSLPPPTPEQQGEIRARILAAHGARDGFVPAERVQAFQDALTEAGADWQLNIYGGARHSFTNPDAGDHGIENLAYDPDADRRSWLAMQRFFDEIFAAGD